MRSDFYMYYIYKRKKQMHRRMHNNDFDILLRSVHYSAKLQIPKIHKNFQKIKYYLYNTSWMFVFQFRFKMVYTS